MRRQRSRSRRRCPAAEHGRSSRACPSRSAAGSICSSSSPSRRGARTSRTKARRRPQPRRSRVTHLQQTLRACSVRQRQLPPACCAHAAQNDRVLLRRCIAKIVCCRVLQHRPERLSAGRRRGEASMPASQTRSEGQRKRRAEARGGAPRARGRLQAARLAAARAGRGDRPLGRGPQAARCARQACRPRPGDAGAASGVSRRQSRRAAACRFSRRSRQADSLNPRA